MFYPPTLSSLLNPNRRSNDTKETYSRTLQQEQEELEDEEEDFEHLASQSLPAHSSSVSSLMVDVRIRVALIVEL